MFTPAARCMLRPDILSCNMFMQVCNHPDLFEGRPIVSSFDMFGLPFHLPTLAMHALTPSIWQHVSPTQAHAHLLAREETSSWAAQETQVRQDANYYHGLLPLQ